MNERIRELALQARKYADDNEEHWKSGPSWDSLFEGKFVELIVRECAEVCKKQEYDYWRSAEDQDFTPQDCADAIEQHFGVE